MPKVSIFMSSYNYARYLRQSIESVLNQTFSDFELFIVDDASEDESWEIIRSFVDTRIHALKNDFNRNDKIVMNEVIKNQAKGEYIAVHHSDNLWEPDKLMRQVQYLDENSEVGAVFTQVQLIDEAGDNFSDPTHPYTGIFDQPNRDRFEWLNFFFFYGNALCHPSVLIRKQVYEESGYYRNGLMQLPDFDMWVRVCLKNEIYILPEKLVKFRVETNSNNISGDRYDSRNRIRFETLKILENFDQIRDLEEMVKVIPSAAGYRRSEGCDLGFVLGKSTLDNEQLGPTHILFGLTHLFDAISDPTRAALVEKLYGFTHKDFAKLAGQYDLFGSESIPVLREKISSLESEIQGFRSRQEITSELISWKIAHLLRKLIKKAK